jgi:long-subunit fatty acid transport protein
MADFGYYFQKDAAWDGAQKEYGNAWDTALGLELAVMPSLKVSTGVAYTNKGTDSKDFSSLESPSYDTIGVGLGFEFEILTDLRFEAAYAKEFYKDIKQEGTGTKLDNTRNAFGFGLKYKFM